MTPPPKDKLDDLPPGLDKTVVKSLALFERLVELGRPVGVTELAVASGLQKSNVHRILSTLRYMGYVRSSPDGLYEPALRAWELGQRIHAAIDIAEAARPILRRLVQDTDETGHLAVFDDHEIVYVDKVDCSNPVRAHTVLGGRAPAHCTASGKALLVGQAPAVLKEVMRRATRHSPSTITKLDELQRAVAQAQTQGYATNIGEFRSNVGGVAAPVTNRRGEVIASVGIAGPLERLQPARIRQLAPVVIAAAQAISAALGSGR